MNIYCNLWSLVFVAFLYLYFALFEFNVIKNSMFILKKTLKFVFEKITRHPKIALQARNHRGKEGGGGRGRGVSPALFRKLEKRAPISRKNALIVVSVINVSFKMKCLRVSRPKTRRCFPCGTFLSSVIGECFWKCPNSKKTPLP